MVRVLGTTFGCVEARESPARSAFAERLRELCEDQGLPKRGRQSLLARQFKVSQQAAKKWLDGDTYPATETVVAIADWADVNVNWLLQGAGPKRGNRIEGKLLVLDEAIHSLPPESATDLMDTLRAKLVRAGRLQAEEPATRYGNMLQAYEQEFARNRP